MSRTIGLAAAFAATAAGLAGCTLSTSGATKVTQTGARLTAIGRTGDQPGYYHFEYARRAADLGTAAGGRTPERGPIPPNTPSDRSVTFGEDVTGLSPGRSYVFRVCGRQGPMPDDVCAGTSSFFTTPSAAQDSVVGSASDGFTFSYGAAAAASADGRDAEGQLSEVPVKGQRFEGRVTCLVVHGARATIGAVGVFDPSYYDQDPGSAATEVVTVVDDPSGDRWQRVALTAGTTPPSCTGGTFGGASLPASSFTVHDAG
jgi:hypothetical protein